MTKLACLICRKAFSSTQRWQRAGKVCPECGGKLLDAGKAFKPPKRRNKKAWAVVAVLLGAGFRFHPRSFMCPVSPVPTKMRDVARWLKWISRSPYTFRNKKQRLVDRLKDGEL